MTPTRVLLLVALVSACFVALTCAKPAAPVHKSMHHAHTYHHQGMSLKEPEEWLADVDMERFTRDFEAATPKPTAGTPGAYEVGAGIWDVTGQIAEIGFMGYAVPGQKGSGIQLRLRSRAFVFVDANPGSAGARVVYVSIDLCMGFQMVKIGVIERLQAKFGPDMYTHANVLISGTHTHATPGGLGGTVLVDITTFGFIKENYEAAVEGIFQSIVMAHNAVVPATIKLNVGQCDGCNINRSPSAYLLDPERGQYANNTDHEMTVLRIENAQTGEEIGMVNFFAVHGTSLNNTNGLVSGDNKGYAGLKFEEMKNSGALPGFGPFIAAFGQSNLGDVSPNTNGPHCPDGSPCDFNTSTCNGMTEGCIATGPGANQYESMEIIGQMQIDAALSLYNEAVDELTNEGVNYRYQYFDMQNINVSAKFTSTGEVGSTCTAAMGYSFAAGTTDGPGDFDFTQGTTSPNPFWAFVSGLLAVPTPEEVACQAPKPILLSVGQIGAPLEWVPYILPEQVFRIGNLWILGVPGEFTTMSGRRLRAMVQQVLQAKGQWFDNSHVVIAGLSNSYSHYITTFEEFQQQRYEGASTLYGPHTLAAHMQNMAGLVESLVDNTTLPTGPLPIDMRNHTFSFMPGVVVDGVPAGESFGSIQTDVAPSYARGSMASVTFWCANPRSTLQTQSSFLFVEQQVQGAWVVVAVDGNYETRFRWVRVGTDQSQCTVEWDITSLAQAGTYRIRHEGVSKSLLGTLTPYTGISSTFTVTA